MQPFRHGHLEREQEGSGSSSWECHWVWWPEQQPLDLLRPPNSSGIPRCVPGGCGKCWTYRVGLWLVEPAVSRAEQVEGHLGVGPHLRQAGQGLTHLQGWRSRWEGPCGKPPPEPPHLGQHQSCWHISEATTAPESSSSLEEEPSQEMGPPLTWPSLK